MSRRARTFGVRVLDILDSASMLGVQLGGACLALSAAYLVWGIVTRKILGLSTMTPWAQQRVVSNVHIAATALEISALVFVACLVIRRYADENLGYLLSLSGVAVYFGFPYAAGWRLGAEAGGNAAFASIVEAFRLTAVFALLPGIALIVRDICLRIAFALSRAVSEGAARAPRISLRLRPAHLPPIYQKCWNMHYCSDFVRRVCPAFRERKSCWRIKRGCRCDEETMLAAMRSSSTGEGFRREMSRQMAMERRRRTLTPADKRARCRRCGIYAEHQRQKYRLMTAVVIPAVLILVVQFNGLIRHWVGQAFVFTEKIMRFASFEPEKSGFQDFLRGGGDVRILEWVFVVWLTLMVLSYSLKAVECYVFKWQL